MPAIHKLTLHNWFTVVPFTDGSLKQVDSKIYETTATSYKSLEVDGVDYTPASGKKAYVIGFGHTPNGIDTNHWQQGSSETASNEFKKGWYQSHNSGNSDLTFGKSTAADSGTGYEVANGTGTSFLRGTGTDDTCSNPFFYMELAAGEYITFYNPESVNSSVAAANQSGYFAGSSGMFILEEDV